MKTYFRNTMYITFVGLTILSSCADEIKDFTVKPNTEQGDGNTTTEETKSLTINASINSTSAGKTKWVVEDVIYVGIPSTTENEVTIDNPNSGFTKFTVSKLGEGATSASFKGEIPASFSGKKLLAFYGNATDMKITASKVTLDLSSQNGILMSSTANYAGEESINVTFGVENASAEIKIITSELSDVTEAVLNFNDASAIGFTNAKEFSADGEGTYIMERNMTVDLTDIETNEYTISFIPTVSETSATMNIALKANKASGDYKYTTTQEISSTENNYNVEIKAEDVDNSLSGEGTEANPYIIDNVDKFKEINPEDDKVYQLSRNLDFTDIEFTSITELKGIFDGNGNTISNISLDVADGNSGIFKLNNGTIKNLTVDKASMSKNGSLNNEEGTGILVGVNNNRISNCNVNNSNLNVSLSSKGTDVGIGLLVGTNKNGKTISECTVNASSLSVSGSKECHVGGLVGYNLTGNIEFSFVKSATTINYTSTGGGANIGGLIGRNKGGIIEGCSTNIDIDTSESDVPLKIAGFIGDAFFANPTTIKGCYTIGTLTFRTKQTYGGFAGSLGGAGLKTLTNCYTALNFNGATDHAFVGQNPKNVVATNCYYVKGTQSESLKIENVELNTNLQSEESVSIFNNLGWEHYQFVTGTDSEPLVITKK